jgi:uncharacterized protein (DUF433 family)
MPSISEVVVKDPKILGGTAIFRGTRVPFQALVDYLKAGDTLDQFLEDFPTVTRSAALAALDLANSLVVEHTGGSAGF